MQLRSQLQPQFLKQAQHASDGYSRWLLNVYNAEVTYFVLQVVATGEASIDGLQLQQADFDDWARGLASTYPSYTQEQQQHERDQ